MSSADMVIADLATECAELRARAELADAAVQGEAEWRERYIAERTVSVIYRQIAVAGFDALRQAQAKIEHLRRDLERERVESARLRETILDREAAA